MLRTSADRINLGLSVHKSSRNVFTRINKHLIFYGAEFDGAQAHNQSIQGGKHEVQIKKIQARVRHVCAVRRFTALPLVK